MLPISSLQVVRFSGEVVRFVPGNMGDCWVCLVVGTLVVDEIWLKYICFSYQSSLLEKEVFP
jgi:hypothetical protein